eukprot:2958964-Alexandrium_andersonii.AAC.1
MACPVDSSESAKVYRTALCRMTDARIADYCAVWQGISKDLHNLTLAQPVAWRCAHGWSHGTVHVVVVH